MCMIVSHTLKLLMMFGLDFAILMMALVNLSHLIRTLTIGNMKPFSQEPRESLDYCFARFESIVSNLRAYGPLAYTKNQRAKQLLYALNDPTWGMKITALEESANFATLDTENLFTKFMSHELSHQGCPNHDASFTSKALITSAHVGGHDANPINDVSSALEFALSSVAVVYDEQNENIPTTRLLCWQQSSVPCTSSTRRGGDHPEASSSAVTPLTSSQIAPRGRSLSPPTSMTTPSEMTTATRATIKRRTALETTIRRSFKRSCPEHVLA
jgi:hypothetical protein